MCCGKVIRRNNWKINLLCLECTGLHGCARQCSRFIWIWVIKEDLIFVGAPSLVGKEVIYPLLLR